MTTPLVIAHRGWHEPGYAENSVAAVRAAYDLGCHAAEVDVRRTVDGQLALIHDPTHLGMMVNCARFSDLRVNHAEDAITAAIGADRDLVIDVKEPADDATWALLTGQLSLLSASERARIAVQTSNPLAACALELDVPGVRVSLLFRHPLGAPPAVAHWATSRMHRGLTATRVRRDRSRGHLALAWTVNRTNRMRALLAAGIDGLITDRPEELLQILAGRDGLDDRRDDAQPHERSDEHHDGADHEESVTG